MKEEKKNSKNNSKIFIGAIIGIVIGLSIGVGVTKYLYDRNMQKDCTTVETDNEERKNNNCQKVECIDVLSDVVQDNFNRFMKAAGHYGGAQDEYFLDRKLNNTDIPNYLVFATIDASGLMKDEMTEKEFEELVKQFFGEDYKYKHEVMSSKMCPAHYYDSNEKKYYRGNPGGCGGASGPDKIFYMVNKAYIEGDNLIMYFKVIFPDSNYNNKDENGNVRYYSDANHTKEITGLERDYSTGAPYSNATNIRKGGSYKVVMKKYKGDTYSFVSSEPID